VSIIIQKRSSRVNTSKSKKRRKINYNKYLGQAKTHMKKVNRSLLGD